MARAGTYNLDGLGVRPDGSWLRWGDRLLGIDCAGECSRKEFEMAQKPYAEIQDGNGLIYHEDVLSTEVIRPASIDLIVTSPPYNVDIQYGSNDDNLSYAEYLDFSRKWMNRCLDWLKPDGRFCLNIPLDKNKGGHHSVGADLTVLANQIGFRYHSTVIWNEGNISRRTAWGSWMSASAPFVIAPVELIVILYKEHWKKTNGSLQSNITREEFMEWTNGIWTFSGESKRRIGHPAPYPLELPRRCIKLFSFVGDTVLDPFLGSGTTLIAALCEQRKAIGVEIDERYCELAYRRVITCAELQQPQLDLMKNVQ